jgi:hypothetical protein
VPQAKFATPGASVTVQKVAYLIGSGGKKQKKEYLF